MTRRTHLANVVAAQLNMAVATGGALLVTPAVLGSLGDSAYGGWLLLNAFIGYMRFVDLGSTAGTVKYGAGAHERRDAPALQAVLDTSAAIFAVAALAVVAGTWAMLHVLPALYPAAISSHSAAIATLGAALAIEMLFRPVVAALRIRLLFWLYDTTEIATTLIFKFGLILYFAQTRGLTYELLATLTLVETIVRLSLLAVASLFALPAIRATNPFHARRDMLRKIGGLGAAVTVMMIADIVRFQLDASVIGYFMPGSPESITIFGIGVRLESLAVLSVGVIAGVLIPRFAALSETGDTEGTRRLLQRTSLYSGLACALILVNVIVLGPQFLNVWLHKPWTPQSAMIMLLFVPSDWIALLSGASKSLLAGTGQLKRLAFFVSGEALCNLVLSVLLIKPFGIVGVALGTVIPCAFFQGVLFPLLLKRETGMSVSDYWRMHTRSVSLGAVYLVLVAALALSPAPTFAYLVAKGAISVSVFAALTLLFVPELRAPLLRGLGRWRQPRTAGA